MVFDGVPLGPSGRWEEVPPTLPAISGQLRAVRQVEAVPWMVTRTHWCPQIPDVSTTWRPIPEERDPELREVDDDVSHAPHSEDSSVDTASIDDREESVMGQEDHAPQVEEEDLELPLPEEQPSGMR